jgi:hypothetical protein
MSPLSVPERFRDAILGHRTGVMGVRALHHVLICVQDPERSRGFYEDLLLLLLLPFIEIPVGADISSIWPGGPGPVRRWRRRSVPPS